MNKELDLVIRNGTLVVPGMIVKADLGIQNGKIILFGQDLSAKEEIDAHGLLVLPGAVDPHVHLDMPAGKFYSSDNWKSGTTAAAYGGTTSVIDFIEPLPDQSLMDGFHERRKLAESQSVADFGLHMTIDHQHLDCLEEIPQLIKAGITSFKIYTTYDFRLEDEQILDVMSAVEAQDGLVISHCENDAIIKREKKKLLQAGANSPASHPLSRPETAEEEAVVRVLALAEVTQTAVYIVHVSTGRGAEAIEQARLRGQTAFGETCPQYLLLNDDEYQRPGFEGAKFVCSPPLRKTEDNLALWQALSGGFLQTVGTDHCPFFFNTQKVNGLHDFTQIPGGIPGIESRLALMYTFGVSGGQVSLNRWVEMCCTNPARIFGMYPRKGALLPGSDADLVLFDPYKKVDLSVDFLHENVDYTPYEGLKLYGYPQITIRRGEVLVREGEWTGSSRGVFLNRHLPLIEH